MSGKQLPQHLEKVRGVSCVTQIATIIATVCLKSGPTTTPIALVPVNKMAGMTTTAALTPTPPQLQIQQRKWKLTSR